MTPLEEDLAVLEDLVNICFGHGATRQQIRDIVTKIWIRQQSPNSGTEGDLSPDEMMVLGNMFLNSEDWTVTDHGPKKERQRARLVVLYGGYFEILPNRKVSVFVQDQDEYVYMTTYSIISDDLRRSVRSRVLSTLDQQWNWMNGNRVLRDYLENQINNFSTTRI